MQRDACVAERLVQQHGNMEAAGSDKQVLGTHHAVFNVTKLVKVLLEVLVADLALQTAAF